MPVEIRAQIDSEVTRGLLLVNGGAAVALMAFLPHVIGDDALRPLAVGSVAALGPLAVALFLAVASNRLRRVCSLRYEQARSTSPMGSTQWQFLGKTYNEPRPCVINVWCIWASAGLFLAASLAVFAGALCTLCR